MTSSGLPREPWPVQPAPQPIPCFQKETTAAVFALHAKLLFFHDAQGLASEVAGPAPAIVAIVTVLGAFWVMMRFIQPIQKIIGTLISTVISKVMLVFIAAIGANMLFTGLSFYFSSK